MALVFAMSVVLILAFWQLKLLTWIGLAVLAGSSVIIFLRFVRPKDREEPWKRPILAGAGCTGLIAALMAVPTIQDSTGPNVGSSPSSSGAATTAAPSPSPTPPRWRGDPPPFSAELRLDANPEGCEAFTIGRRLTKTLPKRADFNAKWAYERGGGNEGRTEIWLIVQGESDTAVILRGMEIVDVDRRPVDPDAIALTTCYPEGGIVDERYFDVNFDPDHPSITPRPGTYSHPLANSRAVKFPFRISQSEPESFSLRVRGGPCLCNWRLAINWSSGGKSGQLIVDRGFSKIITDTRDDVSIYQWRENGKFRPPLPE